jgi:hypothetical protein
MEDSEMTEIRTCELAYEDDNEHPECRTRVIRLTDGKINSLPSLQSVTKTA